MMGWLKRLLIGDGDVEQLDFVPAGSEDCRTPDRIAEARTRYGKPFAPEIKVGRMTEPSHVLEHINARTEAAKKQKATVTSINQTRRKS